MEFQIPVFDTEVDTDDPSESASNVAGALGGGVILIGIVSGAQYLYNRITNVAGSDQTANVPGV